MDPVGPSGEFTDDIVGTGDDFNLYNHNWQGIVHEWGWTPIPMAPTEWTHYTMQVTTSAVGCQNEPYGCNDPGTCEADEFWSQTNCMCWPRSNSPVLINVEPGNYELVGPSDGVWFDMAGKGYDLRLGWTALGQRVGFLVLDRNNNGRLDNGTELFGNFTPLGSGTSPNGFEALAAYDLPEQGGNGDGWIDEHDVIFPSLLLWIDANHNGRSASDELYSLSSVAVTRIGVNAGKEMRRDKYGNTFRLRSTAIVRGQPRTIYDVFFAVAGLDRACQSAALSFGSHD